MVQVREAVWKRRPGWWARNPRYVLFQLREWGGVLTAVYGLVLLGLLISFQSGRSSYDAYVAMIQSLPVLALTAVVLVFVMIHAITWFYLIGKSQAVMSSYRAPGWKPIFGLMLVVFVLASGAVLFLVFGGL